MYFLGLIIFEIWFSNELLTYKIELFNELIGDSISKLFIMSANKQSKDIIFILVLK